MSTLPDSLFPKSKAQLNRERRAAEAIAAQQAAKAQRRAKREAREARPVWGSQQWAETRGDDLGLSPDC